MAAELDVLRHVRSHLVPVLHGHWRNLPLSSRDRLRTSAIMLCDPALPDPDPFPAKAFQASMTSMVVPPGIETVTSPGS